MCVRRHLKLFGTAIAAAALLIAASGAFAASMETLLMPGKLISAHKKWEEHCSVCHDKSGAHKQSALCLGCHKGVAADIEAHRGYHGRMPNAGRGECRACHTDHKGRNADIIQFSRAQFDHRLTDFPLTGRHAMLACGTCHRKGDPWRKVKRRCASCHRRDDVHHGQFKRDCGACHQTKSWSGGRFDHDTTPFHLSGAHAHLECDACHIGGRYAHTPSSCDGCHATDDVHRGARGKDCGSCHSTTRWKNATFDHARKTGFALLGAHDRIACDACHRNGQYQAKIPKHCAGCHADDDAHAGRFGPKCEDCHNNEHWHISHYDHAKLDHFALEGAHASIGCGACHTAALAQQKLPKNCAGCHRAEDPHGGEHADDCGACHGEKSWRTGLIFDHDLSDFPLLGLHRVVACAQCHETLDFQATPTKCDQCHARDDAHKGGLGKKCGACHSPDGWRIWSFNHDTQTHFPLLGAHRRLACAACHHEPPGTVKTPSRCIGCHEKDDRHMGQYGTSCNRCHTVDSWKGARMQ